MIRHSVEDLSKMPWWQTVGYYGIAVCLLPLAFGFALYERFKPDRCWRCNHPAHQGLCPWATDHSYGAKKAAEPPLCRCA